MDPDAIAESFREPLANAHAFLDGMEDGPVKTRSQRLLNVAHQALEAVRDHLADNGIVQPFSGGDPKPPGP